MESSESGVTIVNDGNVEGAGGGVGIAAPRTPLQVHTGVSFKNFQYEKLKAHRWKL